jgi:hypothetical protein
MVRDGVFTDGVMTLFGSRDGDVGMFDGEEEEW